MSAPVVEPEKWCISALLPYHASSRNKGSLKTALNEYSALLLATQFTIDALKAQDFEQFDALVGENMCQSRALKIALMADKVVPHLAALESKVASIRGRVQVLLSDIQPLSLSKISLQDLLDKELDVAVTAEELFFVQTYLLTLAKTLKPASLDNPLLEFEATEHKKLQKLGEISSGFAKAVVMKLREQVSVASVTFIREQALELQQDERFVSEDFTIEHNGCQVAPFFFCSSILIHQALAKGVPVVIHLKKLAKDQGFQCVGRTSFFFAPDQTHGRYELKAPNQADLSHPAFVIEGVLCRDTNQLPSKEELEEKFTRHDPIELFCANTAAHRQYPDPSKDAMVEATGNSQYVLYKQLAERLGCTITNPSLLFINHVFCATVGRQIPLAVAKPAVIASLPDCLQEQAQITETIFSYLVEKE